MTLGEALTAARAKIDRLDARLLLQYATGCTHTDLLARPETPLIAPAYAQFAEWVDRRAAGEPLAYLDTHIVPFGFSTCWQRASHAKLKS